MKKSRFLTLTSLILLVASLLYTTIAFANTAEEPTQFIETIIEQDHSRLASVNLIQSSEANASSGLNLSNNSGLTLECNVAAVEFEAGIPTDWNVITTTGNVFWSTTDVTADCNNGGNQTNGTGHAACADSDQLNNSGDPYDTSLETNAFTIPVGNVASLDFEAAYRDVGTADSFEVQVWDGSSWTTELLWNENHYNPGEAVSVDLTAYAGVANAQVRFHYFGNGWDWYSQVDNVSLSCGAGPEIEMVKTVGTDADVCATGNSINVAAGTDVYYCYEVTNTGTISLSLHDLVDSELGSIISGFPFDLEPAASAYITASANITQTTVNTATWTAYNLGPIDVVSSTSSATVNVVAPDPLACNTGPVTFDAGVPADWLAVSTSVSNTNVIWTDMVSCGEGANYTGGAGDAACASSDLQGGGLYDTEMWSNPFDLPAASIVGLDYLANYGNFALVDFLDLDISTDGGTNWTNLLSWNEDHHPNGLRNAPGEAVSVDLSAYAGMTGLILRWHYYDPSGPLSSEDWYAQVDDVELTCTAGTASIALTKTVGTDPTVCAATDSTTVVAGSDVTYCYEVENTGTITLTTHDLDDDQLGSILSGFAYDLGPGATVFVTQTTTVNNDVVNLATWTATAGAATAVATDTASVTVQAPAIDVSPDASSTQPPDTVAVDTITISNNGDADLNWDVEEAPAASAPRASVALPTVKQRDVARDGVFNCAAYHNFAGAEPAGYAENCLEIVWADGQAPNRSAAPTDMGFAHDIGFISDNVVEFVLNDFPGQTVQSTNADPIFGYDYDSSLSTLYALNSTGGFGTFDEAAGTFTLIGATGVGANLTGLAINPTTNEAYMSTTTNLYSVDLTTGVATLIGAMGQPGGLMIDIAINGQGEMYGHDIGDDAIYSIDTTTGAATLVGSTGLNGNFAQGMDFDNQDGTLYIFLYIGGGANVYGTVDLATGAVTPLATDNPTGEFEGATRTISIACGDDVPWMSLSPTSGTTSPAGSDDVTVSFDSTGLAVGDYNANVCVHSNDLNNALVVVPVTLTVEAPPPAPMIEVTPAELSSTQASNVVVTDTLTIGNVGDADLDWDIEEAASATLYASEATVVESMPANLNDVSFAANANGAIGTATHPAPARGNTTITHSATQNIVSLNSVACPVDNDSYYRTFTLADFGISGAFAVSEVSFGIETSTGNAGSQPLDVNLYTLDGAFVLANLTLIGSTTVDVTDQALSIVSVPVNGNVPAGGTLVVEVFAADTTNGTTFFIGSNPDGQTSPTYLLSAACGASEPTDIGGLGFPDMHMVMNVTGTELCTVSDLPWLSASPTSGTTAPASSSDVTVSFDSTGYGPGTYTGLLCVNSNDNQNPVVRVPVTMTVPVETGAEITPMSEMTGTQGTVVTHMLTVTNTGNVTETITLSALGQSWPTVLDPTGMTLGAGETGTVEVAVTIPLGQAGNSDMTMVTADFAEARVSHVAQVTTYAEANPTDISLTGFGSGQNSATMVWLAGVLVALLGGAYLWRRRETGLNG